MSQNETINKVKRIKFRRYQIEGANFLRKRRKGILNFGCRVGKTATALLFSKGFKTIVVCPPALVKVWNDELLKMPFTHKITAVSCFNKKAITEAKYARFECLIIDEAHKVLGNWEKCKEVLMLAQRVPLNCLLTATPLINTPLDLYWMLKLCGAHNLNKADFTLKFCKGQRLWHKPQIVVPKGISNVKTLKKLLAKVTFSKFREEKIKIKTVSLGKEPLGTMENIESYSMQQAFLGECKAKSKKIIRGLTAICDHYEKVIVFFFHKPVKELIKELPYPSSVVDGSVSFTKRYKIIEDFKKLKGKGFLFLNYKSSGEGLDISGIPVCVFVERSWSPGVDYQAYMRAYGFKREKPLKSDLFHV